jgi:hypothetical protein
VRSRKRRTRTVSRSGNFEGNKAQSVAGIDNKIKKRVPKLSEQNTYTALNLYLKSNQLGHVLYHCYYLHIFRNVIPFEFFSRSKQTARIPQRMTLTLWSGDNRHHPPGCPVPFFYAVFCVEFLSKKN